MAAAKLHRLRTGRERIEAEQADMLRQLVLDFPDLPDRARGEIIAAIDRRTASDHGWPFVMIGPEQFAFVNRWLGQNSKRPLLAYALWGELFTALRRDTGEIMLTREEMAERIGTDPGTITKIMAELESIGAISRRREKVAGLRGPGMVRYFMNPNVATHLAGKARERAQAEAVPLDLAPSVKPKRRPKLAPVD
jgi:CRP-like cAMP-binding protein